MNPRKINPRNPKPKPHTKSTNHTLLLNILYTAAAVLPIIAITYAAQKVTPAAVLPETNHTLLHSHHLCCPKSHPCCYTPYNKPHTAPNHTLASIFYTQLYSIAITSATLVACSTTPSLQFPIPATSHSYGLPCFSPTLSTLHGKKFEQPLCRPVQHQPAGSCA
ncbi:unnamed protein product [Camellia sinensis]